MKIIYNWHKIKNKFNLVTKSCAFSKFTVAALFENYKACSLVLDVHVTI